MLPCDVFIHAGIRDVEGPLYAGILDPLVMAGVLDPGLNAGFLLWGVRELGSQCGV